MTYLYLLLLAAASYLACVCQLTLSPALSLYGAQPNFFALTAILFLFSSPRWPPVFLSSYFGLLCDLVSPGPLGLFLSTFTLSGLLLSYLLPRFRPHTSSRLLLTLLFTTLSTLHPPSSLYTTLLTLPLTFFPPPR